MKRMRLIAAAIFCASLLALAGCGRGPASSHGAAKATKTVTIAAVKAGATGFAVGSVMMAHTIYVFFDAECPHCSDLWESAKPLKTEVRFVWIPVGVLSKASIDQGAAILAAANPAEAMDAHEASMRAHMGGIAVNGSFEAQKAQIRKNTNLLTSFGFDGIPTLIGLNARTGELVTQEGESNTVALAKRFGLASPFRGPNGSGSHVSSTPH